MDRILIHGLVKVEVKPERGVMGVGAGRLGVGLGRTGAEGLVGGRTGVMGWIVRG